MKKVLQIFAYIFLGQVGMQAQCLMAPVSLSQRTSQSTLVIEGKVLNRQSFWNVQHDQIFTSNLIEVYKSFKGTAPAYLEVITEGGTVGASRHVIEPSLELAVGDAGIFTLNANTQPAQFGKPVYEAYAAGQGFIRYNIAGNFATEPFHKYPGASASIYNTIQQYTGTGYTTVKSTNLFAQNSGQGLSVQNVAAITSFSPTNITAGTFSVLTINGSGFGTTTGTVSFSNADNGGATFINAAPAQIVSWTNSQIQVQVPTKTSICGTAGTGVIQVNGVSSSQTLTVNYGHLNVDYSNAIYNTQHIGQTSGGYTWTYNSSFITNGPAKAAFERSFGTWRCSTYINWQLSASTTTIAAAANDGVNVVTFQTGLPAGVLGRCTSYWSGCGSGATMKWFVNELDIAFAPSPGGLSWQYGPAAPTSSQYDFESVTVHELGHGHQLSHVINTSDLMHYALSNGQSKRSLNTDDLNGALAVMARNTAGTVCSQPIMVALTSSNCSIGAPTANFSASKTTICPGQSVIFTDLSTGNPTTWSWSFQGGTPSTASVQNPTVTYNTPGTYSVSLTASNSNGTNTYSVLAYIHVVTASALPLTQDFQGATFPPANWYLVDGGNDNVTWSLSTSAGQASTQSALFDNFTTNVAGTKDELKTYVNLSGFTSAKMTFYRAYGLTYSSPNIDSLEILISTNCGASTAQAYYKGGSQIGTGAGTGSSVFVPTSSQWAKDSIDLTPYVGNSSVMVSFVNRSHYGDGMYLDNINITGLTPVAPTATISASSNTACVGQTISLTNTSTGSPSSYAWTMNGGTPSSAATSSTTVSYATAGVQTISLTVASGTMSSTSAITVTIVANPSISSTPSTATVCAGQSASLTAMGGSSYAWSPGGQTTAGISVSPSSTTVYTVTGTASGCSSTAVSTVSVVALPTLNTSATATLLCTGQTTTLSASGASTYTWNPGNITGSSINVTPASTTTYSVAGTSGACTGNATILISVSNCTGINNTSVVAGISVYPNPSSGEFNIVSGSTETVGLQIYNAIGQLVVSQTLGHPESKINLSPFGKGLYFLQLSAGGSFRTIRLVVE